MFLAGIQLSKLNLALRVTVSITEKTERCLTLKGAENIFYT
jgi:hypothetical protein